MGGKTMRGPGRGAKERAAAIVDLLGAHYPEVSITLDYSNPLELLVATILSAQCTDVRVNKVTPAVFARYPTALGYAEADPEAFMEQIRPAGFFRSKARNIMAAARLIADRHGGQVPSTLEDLVALPGIGRKTANVILGNAFGVPGMVVDTHVGRIARRWGLTKNSDPVKMEFDLMKLFPRDRWTVLSHQIIAHGRRVCKARRPLCSRCFFTDSHCPARRSFL